MNDFVATVRGKKTAGVSVFKGKVTLDGHAVFSTAEFESKQTVQGQIAEWIARQGKKHSVLWNYIGTQ